MPTTDQLEKHGRLNHCEKDITREEWRAKRPINFIKSRHNKQSISEPPATTPGKARSPGWTEANARGQAGLRCDGRREVKKAWIHFTLVFPEPTAGTLLDLVWEF